MRAFASTTQSKNDNAAHNFARGRFSPLNVPASDYSSYSAPLIYRKSSCSCGGGCPSCQANSGNLKISQPNDPAEIEAGQIAEQVMSGPAHSSVNDVSPRIHRFTEQPTGETGAAPASVDRVLASPGRPLEPTLQQEMGHRFGHDFSRVRVHSDGDAEQSAREVNAHAYTVGHNIVFGAGQYAPETSTGQRLIAHELTHIVQQSASPTRSIQRKAFIGTQVLTVDEGYKKIVRDTWGERAVTRLTELHTDTIEHRFANWSELAAQYELAKKAPPPAPAPVTSNTACEAVPPFSQRGGSCAAASLITPVLVWDKDPYNVGDPNPRLRLVLSKMKTYLETNKVTLRPRFDARVAGGYQMQLDYLTKFDEAAADDAFKLTESNYQILGRMLMIMSQDKVGQSDGMNDAEMQRARTVLGFQSATKAVYVFSSFFDPAGELANMAPGQMAQITWFNDVPRSADPLAPAPELPTHAFTIGRLDDGSWIVNDQGYSTPLCLTATKLEELKKELIDASKRGDWKGITDEKFHAPPADVVTGYTILGDSTSVYPP